MKIELQDGWGRIGVVTIDPPEFTHDGFEGATEIEDYLERLRNNGGVEIWDGRQTTDGWTESYKVDATEEEKLEFLASKLRDLPPSPSARIVNG